MSRRKSPDRAKVKPRSRPKTSVSSSPEVSSHRSNTGRLVAAILAAGALTAVAIYSFSSSGQPQQTVVEESKVPKSDPPQKERVDAGQQDPPIPRPDRRATPVYEEKDFVETVKIGPLTFTFHKEFTKLEITRFVHIIKQAFPHLNKYIPIKDDLAKKIQVVKPSLGRFSGASYQNGRFYVNADFTDGLVVHELAHLFHGEKDTNANFVEEGLATAISMLVTEKSSLESWNQLQNVQLDEKLQNGGLSQMVFVPYDYYPPLIYLRYYFAARYWLDMEKERPGFIRDFHEAYYRYLDKGGKKEDISSAKILEIADSIGAKELFGKYQKHNPVMRFNSALNNKNLIYVCYQRLNDMTRSTGLKKKLEIFTVGRDQNGAEKAIPNAVIEFQVVNLDTGRISRLLMGQTNQEGNANIDLKVFENEAGSSSRYLFRYRSSGIQNEIREFTFEVK